MTAPLEGTRALVVGFTQPGSREIVRALAQGGAAVAVASATLDGDAVMEAKWAARDVAKLGLPSFSQGWDVTLPTNVTVGYRQLVKEFGRPGVLVLDLFAPLARPIEKTTDAELAHVHQVNLLGAFYAARTFLRDHEEGSDGRLVFVLRPAPGDGQAAFVAAQVGAAGLALSLAGECAGRGVAVNVVVPAGHVLPGMAAEHAASVPALAGAGGDVPALVAALARTHRDVTGRILVAGQG